MQILEYGDITKEKIILIHGFESPYQIWEKYILEYEKDYHILIPILPGHNPNDIEEFITFDKICEDIENYILEKYNKNIHTVYGMSMGGIVASILIERGKINIKNIIIESSLLVSYGKFMTKMLTKQYLKMTHKTQTRNKKLIKQALSSMIQKKYLYNFLDLIDNISDSNIVNYLKAISKYKIPSDLNFDNIKLYYFHGTKINEMYAKKSAKFIKENYPFANVICLKNKGHCEDSLMNPHIMIERIKKIIPTTK